MKHPAVCIPVYQLIFIILGSCFVVIIGEMEDVYSFELGGFSVIVPQVLFGFWIFRDKKNKNVLSLGSRFFIAETLKLLVCGCLISGCLMLVSVNSVKFVLIGFLTTILVSQVLIFYSGFRMVEYTGKAEK